MRLTNNGDEYSRQWRKRMIEDTCRYIEWGLEHSDKVDWIPAHPVGRETFSERAKLIFWTLLAQNNAASTTPPES